MNDPMKAMFESDPECLRLLFEARILDRTRVDPRNGDETDELCLCLDEPATTVLESTGLLTRVSKEDVHGYYKMSDKGRELCDRLLETTETFLSAN